MAVYRNDLPQLHGKPFLTDGGMETTFVFLEGIDLPHFASFPLLATEEGRRHLHDYFVPFLRLARDNCRGFVFDTPTWRASPEWGAKLGFDQGALLDLQRDAVSFASRMRREFETPTTPIVINGVVGPRGDGYRIDSLMSATGAEAYHGPQVKALADTEADMISAITMTYPEEAIGIARAAAASAIPVVISFTVETDGRLPSYDTLREAIERTDWETNSYPAYYMVNCAHPSHFAGTLTGNGDWLRRIRGIRANASALSHAELDEATELDAGDPEDLARRYRELSQTLKHVCVYGGCCGTDIRHVAAICQACD